MQALAVDRARADHLRRDYWRRYGTTLARLMAEHDVDPGPYLTTVHEIDLAALRPDPSLAAQIAALPGRRIVFTNGSGAFAHRVLAARGLSGTFDAVYGVEHAGFRPKPEQAAFEAVFALDGLAPDQGAMFEDDPRNLAALHAMGMCTVLVGPVTEPVTAPMPAPMPAPAPVTVTVTVTVTMTIFTTTPMILRPSCRIWPEALAPGHPVA